MSFFDSTTLFAFLEWFNIGLPTQVAFAMVALVGYLAGMRMRSRQETVTAQARREIKRARAVARELEQIADSIRTDLSQHRGSLSKFKRRVSELAGAEHEGAWKELCKEAEAVLRPTLRLASQIAGAYDEIRQQSSYLMSFTEVRTDPLTGVSNRRALDETLEVMLAMRNRYGQQVSVAIFDIDHFKRVNDQEGHLAGDGVLQEFAKVLDELARETDFVARYGGEEFVIVMPHTDLEGSSLFSERLRRNVEQDTVRNIKLTMSGGVAMMEDGDDPSSLMARADAALYSAKAAGRNRIFYHDGQSSVPVTAELVDAADSLDAEELTTA